MKMSENKLLRGTQYVKQCVSISKVISCRAREIKELEENISKSRGTKLIFQKLPTHMRRRAMSYKVKRLPRKFRQAHLSQMAKSGNHKQIKRPSRKFRRRPKNLLEDYMKRQRQNIWLETHIWHAKRFHMITRWGYKLPARSCDKTFRACYRASVNHCLLQDLSYISCIELQGNNQEILQQMKLITSSKTGLGIGAKAFCGGNREGEISIFHKNSYPFKAIGQVKFIWKPLLNDNEESCVWFWVHAAFYSEFLSCLIDIFNLNTKTEGSYVSNTFNVRVNELRHSLSRFRLTGHLAHSVIMKAFNLALKENSSVWFSKFVNSNDDVFTDQTLFWQTLKEIQSTAELSPHIILNFIVTDPRFNVPPKRTKAVLENYADIEDVQVPLNLKFGSIWSHDIRIKAEKSILTANQLSDLKKNNIVPAKTVPVHATPVPIMLVQQPGKGDTHTGFFGGWDLILPAKWSRIFWVCLIMRGAKVGGIREFDTVRFEQGAGDFIAPDTAAGLAENNRLANLYKSWFFSRPSNKRVNYITYGIVSPFDLPWRMLINEYIAQCSDSFYVLRDKLQLQMLNNCVIDNLNTNCLIPVQLSLLKRGNIKRNAIICFLKEGDLNHEPIEPLHKDSNKCLRKDLKQTHIKLLKKLQRKRKQDRSMNKVPENSKNIVDEHAERMKSLWLPAPTNLRHSCSREIMGFVTSGDFSLSMGNGRCIGYVVAGAFQIFLQNKQKHVLIRNNSSRQYRLASMNVII